MNSKRRDLARALVGFVTVFARWHNKCECNTFRVPSRGQALKEASTMPKHGDTNILAREQNATSLTPYSRTTTPGGVIRHQQPRHGRMLDEKHETTPQAASGDISSQDMNASASGRETTLQRRQTPAVRPQARMDGATEKREAQRLAAPKRHQKCLPTIACVQPLTAMNGSTSVSSTSNNKSSMVRARSEP